MDVPPAAQPRGDGRDKEATIEKIETRTTPSLNGAAMSDGKKLVLSSRAASAAGSADSTFGPSSVFSGL